MAARFFPRSFTKHLTILLCGVFLFSAAGWWAISSHRINHLLDEQISLRAEVQARQLAQLPSLVRAVSKESVDDVMAIVAGLQKVTDADFITVSNEKGLRLAHPVPERIGLPVLGGDIEKALNQGEAYLSYGVGSLGPSVRFISPIIDNGEIVGMIKVGYLINTIAVLNEENISPLLGFALSAAVLSGLIAWRFSGYIGQKMQHLEPWQLTQTLSTSQGVLEAAHEGLMAVNHHGQLYLINDSARMLLGDQMGMPTPFAVSQLTDEPGIFSLKGEDFIDKLVRINGRNLVMTRVTLPSTNDVPGGAVFSLRAQDEIQILSNKISQVSHYLESLRVTRHEYQNKLSTLGGLLQLGHYQQALDLVLAQSQTNQGQMDSVRQLQSLPMISGLLLANMGKASEKGISVDLTELDGWHALPANMDEEQLSTLVGNLFSNSIEALEGIKEGAIRVAMYETRNEHVLAFYNNGPRIQVSLDVLCQMGYTSKPDYKDHGIGLHLVQSIVESVSGHIEMDSDDNETAFTLYFPKEQPC
ncbi:GHKL domain-containing protein [Grimontia hollisae]|uniref:Sensor histidine kinase DpiB n=1 Tax=Grimontia hollisae TaxID=673 RepID=A0A377J8E2_GRIHO|nr:sensor histidine kinase [Grimontia hollisae]STO98569.1 Sensor histidine kinase DpiB [Grimontia hollisae]